MPSSTTSSPKKDSYRYEWIYSNTKQEVLAPTVPKVMTRPPHKQKETTIGSHQMTPCQRKKHKDNDESISFLNSDWGTGDLEDLLGLMKEPKSMSKSISSPSQLASMQGSVGRGYRSGSSNNRKKYASSSSLATSLVLPNASVVKKTTRGLAPVHELEEDSETTGTKNFRFDASGGQPEPKKKLFGNVLVETEHVHHQAIAVPLSNMRTTTKRKDLTASSSGAKSLMDKKAFLLSSPGSKQFLNQTKGIAPLCSTSNSRSGSVAAGASLSFTNLQQRSLATPLKSFSPYSSPTCVLSSAVLESLTESSDISGTSNHVLSSPGGAHCREMDVLTGITSKTPSLMDNDIWTSNPRRISHHATSLTTSSPSNPPFPGKRGGLTSLKKVLSSPGSLLEVTRSKFRLRVP